MDTLYNNIVGC